MGLVEKYLVVDAIDNTYKHFQEHWECLLREEFKRSAGYYRTLNDLERTLIHVNWERNSSHSNLDKDEQAFKAYIAGSTDRVDIARTSPGSVFMVEGSNAGTVNLCISRNFVSRDLFAQITVITTVCKGMMIVKRLFTGSTDRPITKMNAKGFGIGGMAYNREEALQLGFEVARLV